MPSTVQCERVIECSIAGQIDSVGDRQDSMARVGQGKNYTDPELQQLCLSVLHVSQDPAIGNGQRAERFWDRVQEHYNHHKPAETELRGKKSLEGKWADLKHDVAKFIGCYQQVEGRLVSGTNSDDTLKQAKELYRENHPKGKGFNYECAWGILRDAPRWNTPVDKMARTRDTVRKTKGKGSARKEKESEIESPEIISTEDGDNEEAGDSANGSGASLRRPVGNKRAKEEIKRARVQEDVARISAQAQTVSAAAIQDMARANLMRARTMENNSTIALLSLSIDTMDPELQSFMRAWKLEEAQKLKLRMQSAQEVLPSMMAGQCNIDPPTAVPVSPFPTRPSEPRVSQVLPPMFATGVVDNLMPRPNGMNPLPFVRTPIPRMEGVDQPAAAQFHANVSEAPLDTASSLLQQFDEEDLELQEQGGAGL